MMYLAHNPRGHAILRLEGKNQNLPFQIEILNRCPAEKMSDAELDASTEAFVAGLRVQEAVPLELILAPPKKEKRDKGKPAPPPAKTAAPKHSQRLLMSLVTEPLQMNSKRCAALGMSDGVFARAVQELRREGLAESADWGRFSFVCLTNRGVGHLRTHHNLSVAPLPGKGSPRHRLAVQLLKAIFEARSMVAQVEGQLGSPPKLVDLLVVDFQSGRRTAVEYAEGTSDEDKNLLDDLQAGADRVSVVFRDSQVMRQWERRFRADSQIAPLLSRVDLSVLSQHLPELPS